MCCVLMFQCHYLCQLVRVPCGWGCMMQHSQASRIFSYIAILYSLASSCCMYSFHLVKMLCIA